MNIALLTMALAQEGLESGSSLMERARSEAELQVHETGGEVRSQIEGLAQAISLQMARAAHPLVLRYDLERGKLPPTLQDDLILNGLALPALAAQGTHPEAFLTEYQGETVEALLTLYQDRLSLYMAELPGLIRDSQVKTSKRFIARVNDLHLLEQAIVSHSQLYQKDSAEASLKVTERHAIATASIGRQRGVDAFTALVTLQATLHDLDQGKTPDEKADYRAAAYLLIQEIGSRSKDLSGNLAPLYESPVKRTNSSSSGLVDYAANPIQVSVAEPAAETVVSNNRELPSPETFTLYNATRLATLGAVVNSYYNCRNDGGPFNQDYWNFFYLQSSPKFYNKKEPKRCLEKALQAPSSMTEPLERFVREVSRRPVENFARGYLVPDLTSLHATRGFTNCVVLGDPKDCSWSAERYENSFVLPADARASLTSYARVGIRDAAGLIVFENWRRGYDSVDHTAADWSLKISSDLVAGDLDD